MKKLIIFTGVALIIASCSSNTSNKTADSIKQQPQTNPQKKVLDSAVEITLNGIDSAKAYAMKKQFEKYKDNDKIPQPTSVWFSSNAVHSIDSLLHAEIDAEKKENPNRKDFTSGIRIYFACDPSDITYPLNTTILLVSTFDSLKYPVGKSPHRDYYKHNAPFLSSPFGQTSHDVNEKGARLYDKLFICPFKAGGCIIPYHLITCKQAHNWVKNYVQNENKIAINSTSEWFDLSFIDDLDNELHNAKNHPDGMRIYFAFRDKDTTHPSSKDNRHVFVAITTKKVNNNHVDYFDCKMRVYNATGDNGELCPNSCN